MSPACPALAGRFFTTAPLGDPREHLTRCFVIWNPFNSNNNSMWHYCPHLIHEETEALEVEGLPKVRVSGRAGCEPTFLIQTHYAAPSEEKMEDSVG